MSGSVYVNIESTYTIITCCFAQNNIPTRTGTCFSHPPTFRQSEINFDGFKTIQFVSKLTIHNIIQSKIYYSALNTFFVTMLKD